MRFLSVCSGIEAASSAWKTLGWKAVAFSEIEPFPCAVLAHHYPDVPNHGDMTKFNDWPDHAIDLLAGGTPCQSFSVAGLRKGLDDPRGNLMLTYGAIAAKYRPKWLVWENVYGVLSSNGGRDFGTFLGMLGQLGYGFAYRVLDAQYFGVAQRRRRVFVVGCLGDWRSAAAVLFERYSLSGHPAPSREARKVAPTIPSRSTAGGGLGSDFDCDGGLIQAFGGNNQSGPIDVATARNACASASGRMDFETETFLVQPTHTLRGEGFDASEDGTGRGTPLVPVAFDTTQITSAANYSNPKAGDPCHPLAAGMHAPAIAFPANLSATQHASTEELCPSLCAVNPTAVAFFQGEQHGRMDGGTPQSQDDLPAGAVRGLRRCECGGASQERGLEGSPTGEPSAPVQELSHEGASVGEEMHAVRQPAQGAGLLRDALPAFQEVGRPDSGQGQPVHDIAQGLRSEPAEGVSSAGLHGEVPREGVLQQARAAGAQGNTWPATNEQVRGVPGSMAVRRLLPVECERLQGFPDDYTAIPWRKKPADQCQDGPRYKALGNSWAVPVAAWIGRRIEAVEAIQNMKEAA